MSTIHTTNQLRIFVSLIISMLLVFSLATPHTAHAATLVVDTLLDENDGSCSDGDCSLRDAIQVAAPGDTITFSVTGTIVLTLGQLNVDKDLSISGPGQENLTVSGNNSSRVFYVTGGNTAFSGLTIANGFADEGGGMYNDSTSTTTLTRVSFSNNSAYSISQDGHGGGMYNAGTSTLMDVIFSNNSATNSSSGGGMYNDGTSTLTNIIFSDNSAEATGGGMVNYWISNLSNVIFNDNSGSIGGGLWNIGDSRFTNLTLTKVSFSGNLASDGGGMFNESGRFKLMNVTFSGNSATYGGGGLFNNYGAAYLTNVTISGNSTNGVGGGVDVPYYPEDPSILILKNTLLAGNTAPTGPDCSGTLISYGYNLIQDTTDCTITGDETGNIYGVGPLLGPLADNGGFTLTHALLPGSLAIDTADFTDSYGNPVTEDQRGVSRPQGSANDIGAFEVGYPAYWLWLPFVFR